MNLNQTESKGICLVMGKPVSGLLGLLADKTCCHALSFVLYYGIVGGESSAKLGLTKDRGKAYVQGVDHGAPYTNGGAVIFEMIKE